MRAVVVYESMFGNTHVVADHIATGLASTHEVSVVPVHDATTELRDWFDDLPELRNIRAAAFDTRIGSVAPIMSGRASKGIARRLRHHGMDLVAEPESFLVDADNHLIDGEADRATAWASTVAR